MTFKDRYRRWRLRKIRIIYTNQPTIKRLPDKDGKARWEVSRDVRIEGKVPKRYAARLRDELQDSLRI